MSNIFDEALIELECLDIDMRDVMEDYIKNYDYDLIHKALERGKKLEQYRILNLKLKKLRRLEDKVNSIWCSTRSDKTRMCCRRAFTRIYKLEHLYKRELEELGL